MKWSSCYPGQGKYSLAAPGVPWIINSKLFPSLINSSWILEWNEAAAKVSILWLPQASPAPLPVTVAVALPMGTNYPWIHNIGFIRFRLPTSTLETWFYSVVDLLYEEEVLGKNQAVQLIYKINKCLSSVIVVLISAEKSKIQKEWKRTWWWECGNYNNGDIPF